MKRFWKNKKLVAAVSAGAALLLVGLGCWYCLSPVGHIFLDVNPSVEISTNRFGQVVEVSPVNEDAAQLLEGYRLRDRDLDDVIEDLVDRMILFGYLDGSGKNEILITVDADKASDETVQKVNEAVASHLEDRRISAQLHVQSIELDESLKDTARQNQVSAGKMLLIQKLLTEDPSLNAEELAKMNIADLLSYHHEGSAVLDEPVTAPAESGAAGNEPSASSSEGASIPSGSGKNALIAEMLSGGRNLSDSELSSISAEDLRAYADANGLAYNYLEDRLGDLDDLYHDDRYDRLEDLFEDYLDALQNENWSSTSAPSGSGKDVLIAEMLSGRRNLSDSELSSISAEDLRAYADANGLSYDYLEDRLGDLDDLNHDDRYDRLEDLFEDYLDALKNESWSSAPSGSGKNALIAEMLSGRRNLSDSELSSISAGDLRAYADANGISYDDLEDRLGDLDDLYHDDRYDRLEDLFEDYLDALKNESWSSAPSGSGKNALIAEMLSGGRNLSDSELSSISAGDLRAYADANGISYDDLEDRLGDLDDLYRDDRYDRLEDLFEDYLEQNGLDDDD